MDERKQKHMDPWDDRVYGTGKTDPPKNHGGIIALLLIAVILLSGIVSVLSFLNVQLFQELSELTKTVESIPMSFSDEEETFPPATSEPVSVSGELHSGEFSIKLNPSPEAMANISQEGGLSWQSIYEKNIDSVVSISAVGYGGSSTGTGLVVSTDGYIVTNCHVVEDMQEITILLTDNRKFSASLIGADAISDLAVLHIDATGLTAAEFGDSDALRVGDAVAAIGDPLGVELRGSMTDGIISAINRDVKMNGRPMTLIQTNAALNAGNSGGPLVNCYGQVIGINTMKISAFAESSGVEGLGFAIPSTTVKDIIDQLIRQGYVSGRPTLGIVGSYISRFDQIYYHLPAGLYITEVDDTSDAALQGIEPGDILISINGIPVLSQESLESILYANHVGDSVQTVIFRNGTQYQVTLTLSESKGS